MKPDLDEGAAGAGGPDPVDLYARANESFAAALHAVQDGQWSLPTPCADWDVRTLVNHVVGEELWVVPIFDGKTVADVGNALDGDLLGDDPVATGDDAAARALDSIRAPGAMAQIVHLSFGDIPGSEYTMQLFADHLIHGWDLATAVGADTRLDPELVAACADWFAGMEELYRASGAVGPRVDVDPNADPQTALLARFGRTS